MLSAAVSAWRGTSPLKEGAFCAANDDDNDDGRSRSRLFSSWSSSRGKDDDVLFCAKQGLATEEALAVCLWWIAVYFVRNRS